MIGYLKTKKVIVIFALILASCGYRSNSTQEGINQLDSLLLLGNFYYDAYNYESAFLYYSQAYELCSSNPLILYRLGVSNTRLGDFKSAVFFYQKTLDLKYREADVYYNVGQIYVSMEAFPMALQYLKKAQSLKPHDMELEKEINETEEKLLKQLE